MKEARTNEVAAGEKSGTQRLRLGIVDTETGEMLDNGRMIYAPPKMRIEGFFMANQTGFAELAKKDLNGEAFKLLMLLMSRMDFENAVWITRKEICEVMNMQRQNVSRAMKSLRAAGVFEEETAFVLHLAIDLGWKGKVRNLHKRNSELFKQSNERTNPTEADWKRMDEKIARLPVASVSHAST